MVGIVCSASGTEATSSVRVIFDMVDQDRRLVDGVSVLKRSLLHRRVTDESASAVRRRNRREIEQQKAYDV